MPFTLYLAMTASEIAVHDSLPAQLGYMAIHFSAYGTGLSNIPSQLPPGSVLMLNDRMSIHGHDPELVAQQLVQAVTNLQAQAVILDLQQPPCDTAQQIVHKLLGILPCPLAVPSQYLLNDTAVFLPPPPPNCPLATYIAPYQGRDIWLEAALSTQSFTVTEDGCFMQQGVCSYDEGLSDKDLHCHYKISTDDAAAHFTLWRTKDDLRALLRQAHALGIRHAVGLYQELLDFTV